MKHLFLIYLITLNYLYTAPMHRHNFEQHFKHTRIAQRIFIAKKNITSIFNKIKIGINTSDTTLLQKQLKKLPHVNFLTSLFAYTYEELKCKCFAAQMTVDLEFIATDIQLCIQAINNKKIRLPDFISSLHLGFNSILKNIAKREYEEKTEYNQSRVDVKH